jgi:hypothetical protein
MPLHKLAVGETGNFVSKWVKWSGTGVGTVQVAGTFDSATVTLYGRIGDQDTKLAEKAITGAAYSAAVLTTFEAGVSEVRAKGTGSGLSGELYVFLSEPERP